MKTTWDPTQYEKFKDQRSRPFYDLVGLIDRRPFETAIDLGCGTGELTRKLFDAVRPARLIGLDNSNAMLEKSTALVTPGLTFQHADIAGYAPGEASLDLLFSHAALHWLPNHEALFPKLLRWVRPQGQIAIQMPANFDHASHRIAYQVAQREFPQSFENHVGAASLPVERYAEILFAHGFEDQKCRLEVYGNPMPTGADVVEWTKGTLLTTFRARLSEADFTHFVDIYRRELLAEIGSGPYFYAFKRLLLWARKKP